MTLNCINRAGALFAGVMSCLLLNGCDQPTDTVTDGAEALPAAATILTNGRVYTLDPAMPWAEAVAIGEGKYLYVGDAAGADRYLGEQTHRIDLAGKMLMPGVNDAHAHPWQGGVSTLYSCNFPFSATPDAIAARLRECIADKPGVQWVVGGQWTSDFFRNHEIPSPRAFLDAVSTEHIIYLDDDAGHNAWVNSAALALAGINRDTPDPEGGTFVRDAEGEPNGLLYESARTPIWSLKPGWTAAQYRSALAEALRQANRYGLTGVNEARAIPEVLEAYRQLDAAGELTAHLVANLQTPREVRNYPLDIDGIVAARDKFQSAHLHTDFVKIFLDGVPTASRTALMLDDYVVDEEHPQHTRGLLMVEADTLRRDLIALDKLGFTVKIHAAGDGSVRIALDALQAVREANGPSGLRHELAHAGFIDAQDLPRFAALGVTADLSPYIWYPSPIIDSVVGAVGKRGLDYFPVRDLLDSGANVLMGSDWPSVAKNLSPWHAIEALVTRRNPFEDTEETLWAEQAISLEQALAIATMGGAKAMRLEQLTGSIEEGKSADFIILDRNLFEVPITAISDTQVEQTWFEGLPVYTKGDQP